MGEITGVLVVVLLYEAGFAEPKGWPESCMTVFEESGVTLQQGRLMGSCHILYFDLGAGNTGVTIRQAIYF